MRQIILNLFCSQRQWYAYGLDKDMQSHTSQWRKSAIHHNPTRFRHDRPLDCQAEQHIDKLSIRNSSWEHDLFAVIPPWRCDDQIAVMDELVERINPGLLRPVYVAMLQYTISTEVSWNIGGFAGQTGRYELLTPVEIKTISKKRRRNSAIVLPSA